MRPILAILGFISVLLAVRSGRGGDPLLEGNKLHRAGEFKEAAETYERAEHGGPTLRFNAGVSWLQAGELGKAIERFEEVSVRSDGELKAAAQYNLGCAHFRKGMELAREAKEESSDDEKVRKLVDASVSCRKAVDFFRQVRPQGADEIYNLQVSKTALRAILDEIARMEKEKREREEDEALKSPAELLKRILVRERLHRRLSRALGAEPERKVRLGARRLRKSEAENRVLAEKLARYLKDTDGQDPKPPEETAKRHKEAAERIDRAVEAQKEVEIALGDLDPVRAAESGTRAIQALREALLAFPVDIAALVAELIGIQEANLAASEALSEKEEKTAPEGKGEGAEEAASAEEKTAARQDDMLKVLKDETLQPLAGTVGEKLSEAQVLAEEEEEVVWGADVISKAQLAPPEGSAAPPGPPAPGPPAPSGPGQPGGALDPGTVEQVQKQAAAARGAAQEAQTSLSRGEIETSIPGQKQALEALQRIRDLLPKPPESPVERIRKLIERQQAARKAIDGLKDLEEKERRGGEEALAGSQRDDGREATEIAEVIEAAPDEKAKRAAAKVKDAEEDIFGSAEALHRDRLVASAEAVDRAVEALQEALDILTGKDRKEPQQPEGKEGDRKEDEKKPRERRDALQLTPAQARLRMQEMDRERMEEEKKVLPAPSTITVDRDW